MSDLNILDTYCQFCLYIEYTFHHIQKQPYTCADGAAFEKNRIEELQRAARKDRKKHHDEFTPR